MPWYLVLGVVAVLGIVALVTHLLLTMFNKRGWVYYRNPDAPKGSWLGLGEEIYQPASAHVVDQQTLEDSVRDQAESGDPETAGGPPPADS
ncbi:MAG: hypothetical protein M3112_09905 [Actinomycetia bacterium]|nr:hypothetical protein [Actinomycetes bacterium]